MRTPLRVAEWEVALRHHPDRKYVGYMLRGMAQGFRIGFDRGAVVLRSTKRNMRSTEEAPEVVQAYLQAERDAGRIIGPIPDAPGGKLAHVSRFGLIPKPHQPGKWRLIVDLSHPTEHSVNDAVYPKWCSLEYASLHQAASIILSLGRGVQLAKLDVASAYRIVPVHPDDRPLLGMKWKGELYIDTALPFGLRSAPKIFTAIADGLQYILQEQGSCELLHYLDDFLFMGAPGSRRCHESLQLAQRMCARLGVPLAYEKLEGPATELTFLGIVLDTTKLELRLPEEKLQRVGQMITLWQGKKSCQKKELLSLIGHLQHATRIVKPGRAFLRRMINLASTVRELTHHIWLRSGFKSDLQWWASFLTDWNGISMMSSLGRHTPSITLTSDASGTGGCGAFTSTGQWFRCEWRGAWENEHITAKELLPVVIACALWGRRWQGQAIQCYCDNAAVVSIIRTGWSKHDLSMHLMRSLSLFTAKQAISIIVDHIPGKNNVAADAISRGNLPLFFQQVPGAERVQTPVPQELWELLVVQRPDWTSETWRSRFSTILRWD